MNAETIPTPRTDAESRSPEGVFGHIQVVHSDFARTLERENVALRAALVSIATFKMNPIVLRDIAREAVPDWEKE